MAMRTFDRTVLMRHTSIVTRWLHAVMGAQRVVALRQVLAGVLVQIAERRRQAVAAVLARRTADHPQCVLQPLGQCHEALAAKDDMGMLKARIRQPEVVEPMIEPLTGDRDGQLGHIGEIRQAHPAGLLNLAEDYLLFGTMQGAPRADAAFQGAAGTFGQIGMAPRYLLEDRHRT